MGFYNELDYEPVENRIRLFWDLYRGIGAILPEKPVRTLREDGRYEWTCTTYGWVDKNEPMPSASGSASEIEGSSQVNKTNASENCETSSIGRMLANLGFATKGKRPSREEMEKVARAQQTAQSQPLSPPKKEMMDEDWNNLLGELNQCGSEGQLKIWSALAATYAIPEDKRLLLLQIYQEQKQSLTPAVVADLKKKSAKALPVA